MDVVTLNDGFEVSIRSMHSDDRGGLRCAFERLSPESRYRRFLASKPHLTEGEERYLVEAVDGVNHVALVATPCDDPERIIAVARFIRSREDPASAEFAIVVGDEYQGRGLGGELLERLAQRAGELGVRRFTALMLSDNVAMHRLVARLDAQTAHWRRADGAVDEVELRLAA